MGSELTRTSATDDASGTPRWPPAPPGSALAAPAPADLTARAPLTPRLRTPLRVLQAASAMGGLAQSLAGAAGALLAREVGGTDAVAGLPQALLVAGAAVAALALSAVTRRAGRRPALAGGLLVALAGAGITLGGGATRLLPVVLAGSFLLGAGNTVVMLSRYAAADLVAQRARGRAMGAVLAATTVGSVAGPNLLAPAGSLATALGLTPLTGPYLLAAVGFACAAATLTWGLPRRPRSAGEQPAPPVDPTAPAESDPGGRSAPPARPASVAAPRRGRQWVAAVGVQGAAGLAVLTIANLVMVSVMTMAPVHLHHRGSGLAAIGLIISLHIAGMFAPSPLSGWVTDRAGPIRAAVAAGVVLVVASGSAAAAAGTVVPLTGALVLLGVGWNLALLSGSALVTAGVPAGERPRREGWGEVGMGVAAAGGGVAAGPLLATGGYAALAVAGALAAAVIVPVARWSRAR